MVELNERQIAHRRAMMAHMTQLARRGESRFFLIQGGRSGHSRDYSDSARERMTSSLSLLPKPGRSGIAIVPATNRSEGISTSDRQSTSPY
jgi:hypothetical protein